MEKSIVMTQSARRALENVLALRSGEKLLVISDEEKKPIGEAFLQAGCDLGAVGELFLLPEKERPLVEIPITLQEKILGKDIVINAFRGLAEETPFRVRLIKTITTTASRLGHCPGINEAMMTQGPLNINYAKMVKQAEQLMAALDGACSARIQAPSGTDLKLGIEGRSFKTDVEIKHGTWGNLPAGEIWCGPEETKGDGVLVCDGSVGDLGNVPAPLRIDMQGGKITKIQCEDAKFAARVAELTALDAEASVIGELGIGLNPGARLTGNMLEDEKAFETAHIAFGNNTDMPGGENRSRTHRDFLFRRPTIWVSLKDGTERQIMADGKIMV